MENSTFKTLYLSNVNLKLRDSKKMAQNFSDFEAWWSEVSWIIHPRKSPTLFCCYHEVRKMLSKKNMVNLLAVGDTTYAYFLLQS